jgi:phytoene dehydrogenase-like protein
MANGLEKKYDVVIVGSGPNGLSAGIYLAKKGMSTLIIEAADTAGGGMRTAPLTLPGFSHDVCSAVHPVGVLSPFFKTLGLEKYGLEWIYPQASVAHPLDSENAVILYKSIEQTADGLGEDARMYKRILQPLADHMDWLMEDSFKPLGIPKHPLFLAKFGMKAFWPAMAFADHCFKEKKARALFAGCAAHSILPFDKFFTTAIGLVFLSSAHAVNWPVAKGGSSSIASALLSLYTSSGGDIKYNTAITDYKELPEARVYIFDTDPYQVADIAKGQLPASYSNRLKKYNVGPGIFKIDYALNGPIPWSDPHVLEASTVHLGGTIEEIAKGEKDAWQGRYSEKPYVLMAQQSQFDSSRSPAGQHTCWAYCHVPFGSDRDMSEVIENQIERFAPGFKKTILAKHSMNAKQLHSYNLNYVGGAVTGGAADITQLFTRPVARFDPYSTPNDKIFMCSASTPPGGGVHGMNGYYAALSVIKKLS